MWVVSHTDHELSYQSPRWLLLLLSITLLRRLCKRFLIPLSFPKLLCLIGWISRNCLRLLLELGKSALLAQREHNRVLYDLGERLNVFIIYRLQSFEISIDLNHALLASSTVYVFDEASVLAASQPSSFQSLVETVEFPFIIVFLLFLFLFFSFSPCFQMACDFHRRLQRRIIFKRPLIIWLIFFPLRRQILRRPKCYRCFILRILTLQPVLLFFFLLLQF